MRYHSPCMLSLRLPPGSPSAAPWWYSLHGNNTAVSIARVSLACRYQYHIVHHKKRNFLLYKTWSKAEPSPPMKTLSLHFSHRVPFLRYPIHRSDTSKLGLVTRKTLNFLSGVYSWFIASGRGWCVCITCLADRWDKEGDPLVAHLLHGKEGAKVTICKRCIDDITRRCYSCLPDVGEGG